MEKKSQVVLVRCEDYREDRVRLAIQKGLRLLGGISRFSRPDEKIVLKPNILVGDDPKKCVGPHPQVFRAVAEEFAQSGANLSFGDSPGFGNSKSNAKRSGLLDIAENLGIPFADFENAQVVSNPDGKLINRFEIANSVIESDGLISISKMKSHALTRITGAIKNQFGCIPGPRKAEYHSVLPSAKQFSKMLVDLNLLLKPRLFIMDGIVAMEGNGPRNGDPRPMQVVLLSTDPVALDTIVCKMIGLDLNLVEPIIYGVEFGLGNSKDIEVLGDPVESFYTPDFKVNRSHAPTAADTSFLSSSLMRRFSAPRPTIDAELCTKCGHCVTICPAQPKALSWPNATHDDPPVYDYGKCIRCYCCQEMCPSQAITIKIPLIGRLIHR